MTVIQTSLEDLRRQIDDIDDAMHDLLMRRTEVVQRIAALKEADGGSRFRPGREASVLRRLVRRHRGPFPRPVLVNIWRQLMSALVGLQGPFSVAVYEADAAEGYRDLARDHFGGRTPIVQYRSVRQVVRSVMEGAAAVGVLPEPEDGEADPWWRTLLAEEKKAPRIVARLPFAGSGNGREDKSALVIAGHWPEPTGHDHAFLVIETEGEISRARLRTALTEAGLAPRVFAALRVSEDPLLWQNWVEVTDYVAPSDSRLAALVKQPGTAVKRIIPLGACATPLTAAELLGPDAA